MTQPGSSAMLRDIYVRLIRVHLLYHAAQAPLFGLEMIAELRRHGYKVGPGTLYPILYGLERAGYLRSTRQVVTGKVRRYYRITSAGRKVFERLRVQIRELVGEIFEHEILGRLAMPRAGRFSGLSCPAGRPIDQPPACFART